MHRMAFPIRHTGLALALLVLFSAAAVADTSNQAPNFPDRPGFSAMRDLGAGETEVFVSSEPLVRDQGGISRDSSQPGYTHSSVSRAFRADFDERGNSPVRFTAGSGWVAFEPLAAKLSGGRINGNKAVFVGSWPKSSVIYTVEPSRLKEEIALDSAEAGNSFSFKLRVQGVIPRITIDGGIEFIGTDGRSQFQTPAPFAYDSGPTSASYGKVQAELRQVDGDYILDYTVDPIWLADQSRVFPVIVDPTVTVNNETKYFTVSTPQTITWRCSLVTAYGRNEAEWAGYFAVYDPAGNEVVRRVSYTSPSSSGSISVTSSKLGSWKVSVWGEGSTAGGSGSVTYAGIPVATPISPTSGARVYNASPEVSWSFSDPDGHTLQQSQVQFSQSSTFASGVLEAYIPTPVKTTTPPSALVNGTWYWRVRTQCSTGAWSAYSASQTLIVDENSTTLAPTPYVKEGSLKGEYIVCWTTLPGISTYRLDIGTAPAGADQKSVQVTGNSYSYTPMSHLKLHASVVPIDVYGELGQRSTSADMKFLRQSAKADGTRATAYFWVELLQTLRFDAYAYGHASLFTNDAGNFELYDPSGVLVYRHQVYGNTSRTVTNVPIEVQDYQIGKWRIEAYGTNQYSGASGTVYYERNLAPSIRDAQLEGQPIAGVLTSKKRPVINWSLGSEAAPYKDEHGYFDEEGHYLKEVSLALSKTEDFANSITATAGQDATMVQAPSDLDDGLWYCRLQATDAIGAASPWLPLTPWQFTVDTVAPSVPGNLTVTSLGGGSYLLTWDPATDEGTGLRGYRVAAGTTPECLNLPGVFIDQGSTLSCQVDDVPEGTIPFFTIRAEDLAGNLGAAATTAPDRTVKSSWEYDAAGNRTQQTRDFDNVQFVTTYRYSDANELEYINQGQPDQVHLEYDDNGNLIKKTVDQPGGSPLEWTYTYDFQNRLTSVKKDTTTLVAYAYDSQGRRIREAGDGKLTIFIYDVLDVIYEETYSISVTPEAAMTATLSTLGSPISSADYVRANGQLVAKVVPGAEPDQEVVTYYHLDHLGSVRMMTDSQGQVVGKMDYEPFGAYLPGAYGGEHFGFTGQRNEDTAGSVPNSGIGLYYYGARFYDPSIGRFITQDPAQDGLNWYVYCNNNPLKYVDPDGRTVVNVVVSPVIGWASRENLDRTASWIRENAGAILEIAAGGAVEGAGFLLDGGTGVAVVATDGAGAVLVPAEAVASSAIKAAGAGLITHGLSQIRSGRGNGGQREWNKGSYESPEESLEKHFAKHGEEVGAKNAQQYWDKANGFGQNLSGARRKLIEGATEGVVRYIKNGRYLDLAPDGSIVSFGKAGWLE